MQANTITLAVDVLNNGTNVDQTFTRYDDSTPNRSTYIGAGHTLSSREQFALLRTFPKRTGAYYGSAKAAVKFTTDVVVAQADGADTTAPLIAELSFSIPVGVAPAKLVELRQRLLAILDRDDVVGALTSQLSI